MSATTTDQNRRLAAIHAQHADLRGGETCRGCGDCYKRGGFEYVNLNCRECFGTGCTAGHVESMREVLLRGGSGDALEAGYRTLEADAAKTLPIMDGDTRPRLYCSWCRAGVLVNAWDDHVTGHQTLDENDRAAERRGRYLERQDEVLRALRDAADALSACRPEYVRRQGAELRKLVRLIEVGS